jgi:hypothetical protein
VGTTPRGSWVVTLAAVTGGLVATGAAVWAATARLGPAARMIAATAAEERSRRMSGPGLQKLFGIVAGRRKPTLSWRICRIKSA